MDPKSSRLSFDDHSASSTGGLDGLLCSGKDIPRDDLGNVRFEIMGPGYDGRRKAELDTGDIQGVVLIVLQQDVEDSVLVLCDLPVFADEAAAVGFEGEGHFAD